MTTQERLDERMFGPNRPGRLNLPLDSPGDAGNTPVIPILRIEF